MHTRTSLLRGLGWFVLANALLFAVITVWFWHPVIEPPVDAPAAAYRLLNTLVHWPLLALLMAGLPTALAIVLLPRRPWLRWAPWLAAAVFGGVAVCVVIVDAIVFAQYRMHLGPYVWGLVAGGAGAETFLVYADELPWLLGAGALAVVAAEGALFALCARLADGPLRPLARPAWAAWVALFLGANLWHAWADAHSHVNITQESGNFPFHRPLTAKRALRRIGVTDFEAVPRLPDRPPNRALAYPREPLQCTAPSRPRNVLLVVVDAWRADHLDPRYTPHIAALAPASTRFSHHVSGGNVTRFGIFSMFYGLSGNYWWPVLAHQTPPVLMTQLQRHGYDFAILGSAPLVQPEFDRTVFAGIEGLRLKTPGDTPYARDQRVVADMVAFLSDPERADTPFFGFLWLNSVHSYAVPPGHPQPFQPAWDEVNHMALRPGLDRTPFLNRYRNALHFVDGEVGKVLQALDASGLADDTLLVVTSDHGEEFNDTGKNYWGHNGNFSPYQVQVPLLVRGPGWPRGETVDYLTTHNDLAPTLLTDVLNCTTAPAAYSLGTPLREVRGRRDYLVVVDYNDTGVYERDRITVFSPFGGFPVYSHDYDRLDAPGRADRIRAASQDMVHFSRRPAATGTLAAAAPANE